MKLITAKYTVKSECLPKAFNGFRMAVLSDLHDTVYGEGNIELYKRIEKENPDAVLIAGDLITGHKGRDYSSAIRLLLSLSEKFPVYYALGNHEARDYENIKKYMKEIGGLTGVTILDNDLVTIDRGGECIVIAGLTLDPFYYQKRRKLIMQSGYVEKKLGEKQDAFTVLLAHFPDYFAGYAEWGADLVFSGHLHGGLVRLPLVGGVLSPQIKLFPKYDKGEFKSGKSTMIVSAGLGTHSVPRIFNPAELLIVEILTIEKGLDF